MPSGLTSCDLQACGKQTSDNCEDDDGRTTYEVYYMIGTDFWAYLDDDDDV
jgi:hypothetical protein